MLDLFNFSQINFFPLRIFLNPSITYKLMRRYREIYEALGAGRVYSIHGELINLKEGEFAASFALTNRRKIIANFIRSYSGNFQQSLERMQEHLKAYRRKLNNLNLPPERNFFSN